MYLKVTILCQNVLSLIQIISKLQKCYLKYKHYFVLFDEESQKWYFSDAGGGQVFNNQLTYSKVTHFLEELIKCYAACSANRQGF